MFELGYSTLRHLKTVKNLDLIILVSQAIKLTQQDFTIIKSGGFRTAEQQNEIFKKGYSLCDGYEKKSYHQSGNAVDLVPFINGKASWSATECKAIVRTMKFLAEENGVNLTCGYDWNDFFDPYHYEIRG